MPSPELDPKTARDFDRWFGPVVADFHITQLPRGKAPEYIRQAWLTEGLLLPLRQKALANTALMTTIYFDPYHEDQTTETATIDPAEVTTPEAVRALMGVSALQAADYWRGSGWPVLVFQKSEGVIIPRSGSEL